MVAWKVSPLLVLMYQSKITHMRSNKDTIVYFIFPGSISSLSGQIQNLKEQQASVLPKRIR